MTNDDNNQPTLPARPENRQAGRAEHLAWCKERALKYLDEGDINNAVTSMMSDLTKHLDLGCPPVLEHLGMLAMMQQDEGAARRWITGFN